MTKAQETAKWLKDAKTNRGNYTVWIGKNGNAVYSSRDGHCLSISITIAHRFIRNGWMAEIEVRPDGILLANAA